MSPSLQQQCERLAEEYAFMAKGNAHEVRRTGFMNGFTAAVPLAQAEERERLAKLGGEFDPQKARECFFNDYLMIDTSSDANSFEEGARWQHSQDSAVISALREEPKNSRDYGFKLFNELAEEKSKSAKLLGALKELRYGWTIHDDNCGHVESSLHKALNKADKAIAEYEGEG